MEIHSFFSIDTYIRSLIDFTSFISTYLEIMDATEQCFDTRMEELLLKKINNLRILPGSTRSVEVCLL